MFTPIKLQRTIEQWENCNPRVMTYGQSQVAINYAFEDAKKDIIALSKEIIRLNALLEAKNK